MENIRRGVSLGEIGFIAVAVIIMLGIAIPQILKSKRQRYEEYAINALKEAMASCRNADTCTAPKTESSMGYGYETWRRPDGRGFGITAFPLEPEKIGTTWSTGNRAFYADTYRQRILGRSGATPPFEESSDVTVIE